MTRLRIFSWILVLVILATCFIGCKKINSTFSGSKTGNDNQFLVNFDALNSTVNNDMPLSNGDSIDIEIDIEEGQADIRVENENGTVIYQGNDVENGNFSLGITESGNYTFYVTGYKAKGWVHFVKSLSDDITVIPKESEEDSSEADNIKHIAPVIWYADITQDGIDDKIVVDLTYVINYPKTGEEQTVSVYSGYSGELIWTGHADTVHPGWNGIYIYNDGEKDYLIQWLPTIYQDNADFYFRIFSLDEDGKENDLVAKNIHFDICHPKNGDTDKISEFVGMVNGYLEKSYVLVDTDNGTPVYSTADNKIVNLYDVSWILEEIKSIEENTEVAS